MRPIKGICVDGSSRGNPGIAEYKAIDLSTGKELFKINIGVSTNNIAEFIGLTHAINFARKNGYDNVYSDSQTAIAWVRNRKAKTSLRLNSETSKSINYLQHSEKYLQTLEPTFFKIVKKWETKKWGENPADFGYK